MGLNLKLALPILIGYAILAAFLHYIGKPTLLLDGKNQYQYNQNLLVSSVEPEITRGMLSNDYATLHTYLSAQMELNSKNWRSLTLKDDAGNLLYPFDLPVVTETTTSYTVRHELSYLDTNLGVVLVVTDWIEQRNALEKKLDQFEAVLLAVFGLIILSALVWQNFQISRPIKLLTAAAVQVSKGTYSIEFPKLSRDEVGQLGREFENMLDARREYEESLRGKSLEVKLAHDELSEQKFAIDQHTIVSVTDLEGTITFANKKFQIISGYGQHELIGENFRLLKSGVHNDEFYRDMYQTICRGKVWHKEMCNRSKDGSLYWQDSSISPFHVVDGSPCSYISISTDISELKATEISLIDARNKAEQAAVAKSEFLATMSHEIRTPMNGVMGMLGLLLKTKLKKEQHHKASVAHHSAQLLLTIINDILDFSKIDTGRLTLEYRDFDLVEVISELAESLALRVQEEGVEFIVDVSSIDLPMVRGDDVRVRQILSNLIGNAAKFTHSGEVIVRAEIGFTKNNEPKLLCSVTDSGIGIPPDKLTLLFDQFSQVDSSNTREYGGTGLGLSIAQKLSVLMGGNLTVSSELGKGSCFEFDLVFQKSHAPQPVVPNYWYDKLTVLIIDNNSGSRSVLRGQLERWSINVEEATNGVGAMALLQRGSEHGVKMFNLILVDMGLLDEGEVIPNELKQRVAGCEGIFWVCLTPASHEGGSSYLSNLGFNDRLRKPVKRAELTELLGQAIDESNIKDDTIEPFTQENLFYVPHDSRYLLVEDNQVNQLVIVGIVEDYGISAEMMDIAENGQEAIDMLILYEASGRRYDLVFMDCQMPVMNGYEATRAIRRGAGGETNKNIPVIAMTANAMVGDKEKCFESGMSDFISKPIEPQAIEAMLSRWLSEHHPANLS